MLKRLGILPCRGSLIILFALVVIIFLIVINQSSSNERHYFMKNTDESSNEKSVKNPITKHDCPEPHCMAKEDCNENKVRLYLEICKLVIDKLLNQSNIF